MKPRTVKITTRRVKIRRRGNALIETAFVLPFVLWVVLGALTYSEAYLLRNTLQGAAREGARTAIIQTATKDEAIAAAKAMMKAAGYDESKTTVSVTQTNGTNISKLSDVNPGTLIKVTVGYKWKDVPAGRRPLPEKLGGLSVKKGSSDRTIEGSAVMRRE
jgi:Flp pilus assembly protein TadG